MSVQAAYKSLMEGKAQSKQDLILQGTCKEWIWEFLLKHSSNSHLLRAMATAYPLPDNSLHLKRLLLLRSLSFELSENRFTDRTLETMSAFLSLYRSEDRTVHFQVPVTHADGKTVLCQFSLGMLNLALRVECTIQHLRAETDDWPKFYESLQKHWSNVAEDSEEQDHDKDDGGEDRDIYLKLKEDLWAVTKQPNLRHGILKMHKREYVVRMIQGFLNEAWKELGQVFLECVEHDIREDLYKPDGFLFNKQAGNRVQPLKTENSPLAVDGSLAPCNKFACNRDNSEIPEKDMNADEVNKTPPSTGQKRKGIGAYDLEEEGQTCISPPPWAGSPCINETVTTRKRPTRAPLSFETNKTVASVSAKGCLESPFVLKAQIELKDGQANLNAVVQDPLPEAIKIAEDAAKSSGIAQQAREQTSSVNAINQGTELLSKNNINDGDDAGVMQEPQVNQVKKSIMDRNPTAHTIEWETSDDIADSLDDQSPSNSRHVRLPKLKVRQGSVRQRGISRCNEPRRRKFRKWILEEENVLRKEVARFGKGHWKHILNSHKDIFDGRTEVDLKDKWRNIERSEGIS